MSRRGGGRRGHGLTGFEEGGGYMAVKIAKLQNQYKESVDTEEGEAKKGLFNGVAIFVNGYTEPTAEELKRVMMVHGGTYHHYYSRTNTTHIIANNLPDSKVKNMNTERIVSPKWITDSLAAGHLLDYTKYILYTRQSKDQPRLQFKPAPPPDTGQDSSKSVEGESSRESEQKSETCQDVSCISPVNEDLFAQQINAAASDSHRDAEADTDAEGDFERHVVNSTNSPSTSTSTTTIQNNSPVKGRAMSTANPKFLSEFYNNSRLHHISTMGAMFKEYVNELQNKCDGFPGREKLKNWIMNKDMSKSGTHIREGSPHLSSSFQGKNKRVIMHIDMDCFFVSVGLRKHPHLCEKAVAVTHARGNSQGQVREGMDRQYELNFYKQRAEKKLKARMLATGSTKVTDRDLIKQQEIDAEISEQTDDRRERKLSTINLIDETSSMSEIASCNYEARKAGVRNGMFLGPALKLCPNLKTIPYDFEGYKEVSYKLYDIVASFTHDIEAVSCDEMFVDLTDILQSCKVSPEDFTTYLRERVYTETGCPCSAGLGPNMLVARMATRHAKPNGQHWADPGDLPLYMQDHKATELPGVGWSTGKRLEAEGLTTCGDLQRCALSQLQTLLGPRTGHSLYNYCRGLDTRAVKSEHVRKSVSAEVNYGIRFTCLNDAHKFIGELATEVEGRLAAIKMKGRCITVKLKVRAKDAPVETAKFMGHGVCDNIAKSVSLSSATSSAAVIERETLGLLKLIKTPPQDFRGVGIQVSRLETACASKSAGTSIRSFLLGAKRKAPDIEASLAGGLATDVSTCASETTLAENRNPEVAAKESQECKLSNQRSDAGHSAGTSHLPSGNPEPTTSNNTSSSEAKSIDMEVLLALPEDMRDQVIAEYRQQGYIIPTLPSGRGNAATIPGMSEPQPGTSGYVAPKAEKRQVTHSINQPQSAIDGVEGSKKAASSEVKESEGNGNNAMANVPNTSEDAAAVRQPCGVQDVAETSNSNSNFSTAAENAQNSELVTSFSQVDSSFLEALPEELRQELKQDLERLKQREGAAAVPGNLGLRGSPVKQKNLHTRGRGRPRGSTGRRGRGSKADSRRVEAEGLVTLTSMMLGNTGQPGNFKIKKNIPGGKKRDRSPSSKVPGTDLSSPNKRERLPRVNDSPEPPAAATDELPTTEQVTGKKVEAEILPDLCGMKELADVKSLMQAWVASCAHPENEDADILGSYFTSLITFRDLEKLDCLIKYLYRQILRTQNKLWESAYQVVINQVQSAMVEAYGTKLKVTVFDRS